jgi:predicted membrane channel-forming protein YqfA (hemolysin III family)
MRSKSVDQRALSTAYISQTTLSPHTRPGARSNRWLARISLAGVGYTIVVWTAFLALRPDMNPVVHYLSEYVHGPYGALMTSTFFTLGLAWAALAASLYRTIMPADRSWIGPIALGLCSLTTLSSGIFPADPSGVEPTAAGGIHHLLGTIFFTLICPAMLALAAAWRRDRAWASRTRITLVLGGMALAGVIFMGFGPPELSGLAQRWTMTSVLTWHLLAAWRVYRLSTPRPSRTI